MRQGRTIVSLVLVLGVFAPLNAVELSLIDFTTYNDNIAQVVAQDQELYEQAIADRPELNIQNFGWPDFAFEAGDWNLENWRVKLNASADTVGNNKNSMIKNSPSQAHGNVLGVRLQFRPWANAFWANITTPFYQSPTYPNGQYISETEDKQDNGLAVGLLVNVGQIKNVRSWVYGLNYNYTYGVAMTDENEAPREYGMGSVFHEGWRRLGWTNEEYLEDPNDWEPTKNPLYPFAFPYIQFKSLAFYKPDGYSNPDFIGYVRDVTVDFDLAIIRENQDINDEAIWQMFATSAIEQRVVMAKILAEELLLRRNLLKLKAANDAANDAQQGGAAADDAAAADAGA